MASTCARCSRRTNTTKMSIFNMDTLCIPCCDDERRHPRFAEAREAEAKAIAAGNYNFKGIGWTPPEPKA